MRQVAAVLLSALLMWASFPPLDVGLLIFVAPAPFLWALRTVASPREAGWLGFLFGFAFWGGMLWWIIVLGMVAWLPLSVVMGLWGTGYALTMYLVRTASPLRWWSVAVGMWASWEFLRARVPFGGFPWGSTGYAVGDVAWARGAAQWIGATGWGVVAVGVAAGVVLAFEEERDRRPLEMSVVAAVVLAIAGAFFVPDAGGPQVRVAIVQGNSPCPRVHCEDEKVRILNNHMALTEQIPAGSADLVVWGEDSFGGSVNPTFNGDVRREMGAQAVRIGAYLLAGGTRPGPPGQFDNYNVLFDPSGQVVGEYMKRHPVPFGEYVPFRSLLQIIPQLDAVPNDMRRGEGAVVFPVSFPTGDAVLGSVISFEGAFARTIRSGVARGGHHPRRRHRQVDAGARRRFDRGAHAALRGCGPHRDRQRPVQPPHLLCDPRRLAAGARHARWPDRAGWHGGWHRPGPVVQDPARAAEVAPVSVWCVDGRVP
jgi:apolipoprotein N-acyltransferase